MVLRKVLQFQFENSVFFAWRTVSIVTWSTSDNLLRATSFL